MHITPADHEKHIRQFILVGHSTKYLTKYSSKLSRPSETKKIRETGSQEESKEIPVLGGILEQKKSTR